MIDLQTSIICVLVILFVSAVIYYFTSLTCLASVNIVAILALGALNILIAFNLLESGDRYSEAFSVIPIVIVCTSLAYYYIKFLSRESRSVF